MGERRSGNMHLESLFVMTEAKRRCRPALECCGGRFPEQFAVSDQKTPGMADTAVPANRRN
jgi:hypothetical protein